MGFYDYDSAVVGEDGVLFKDPFTSLPSSYSTEIGVGTHVYTADGYVGADDTAVWVNTFPNQADLNIEGTFQALVNKEALATVTTTSANFLQMRGGKNTNYNISGAISGSIGVIASAYLLHKDNGVACHPQLRTEAADPEMVEFVCTWDQGGFTTFWNGIMVFDCGWVDTTSTNRCDFSDGFRINGSGSTGGTMTWKNVLISSKKVILPTGTKGFNAINFYGNSYPQQGQYPSHDASDRESWPNPGPTDTGTDRDTQDGQTATSANGLGSGQSRGDAAMCITVQRELAKAGLYNGYINNWPCGGGGFEATNGTTGFSIDDRIVVSLNGSYGIPPDIAIIVNGYNDATITPTTMQASIQASINRIVTANSDVKIFICTQPYHEHASFVPTHAEVVAYNVLLTAVATATPQVTLIDIYTQWGGEADTFSSTYWAADNIHPSQEGQVAYGKAIANAIMAS